MHNALCVVAVPSPILGQGGRRLGILTYMFFSTPRFRPVGETTSFTSLDLHPSNALTHRFVLQGLEKFTSYQVVVQAYNKQGLGPASTAAVATTTEDGKSFYRHCNDHRREMRSLA